MGDVMNMDRTLADNLARVGAIREAVSDYTLLAALTGRFLARRQLEQAKKFAPDDIPATGLKRAIQWLLDRTNMIKSEFKRKEDAVKARSWTVAWVYEDTVLESIKRSLAKAIEDGATLEQWEARLNKRGPNGEPAVMEQIGLSTPPGAKEALAPYHAETVFRVGWQNAFQGSIRETLTDEDLQDVIWGYEYSAVSDDRTRDEHEAASGTRLPKDDPWWGSWWPPNGFNCRCMVIPITWDEFERGQYKQKNPETEVRDRKTKELKPVRPDPGWAAAPGPVLN